MLLDDAFNALKTYDWGTDRELVGAITDAVTASHGHAELKKDLETRLVTALGSEISRDAKDFVCRMLTIVGSSAAVPALAGLLPDEQLSHMARYALERIPDEQAGNALREALPNLAGKLKIGAIGSLGSRRDVQAVRALGALLGDVDAAIARAAANALGSIGTAEAAQALQKAKPAADATRQSLTDGRLACAEALLAGKNHAAALAIYLDLAADDQPRLVRLAATRGQLACAAGSA
jgi:HEAT repeat protein